MRASLSLSLRFAAVLISVVLLTSVDHAHAEWDAASTELYRKQQLLFQRMWAADEQGDYDQQLALLKEVRELTAAGQDQLQLYGVAELDFFAQDMERARQFTAEERKLEGEVRALKRQALVSNRLGEYAIAAEQYEQVLELVNRLYGPKSYKAVWTCRDLANAIAASGVNLEKGIRAAQAAAEVCLAKGMEESLLYGGTQEALLRLHWNNGDHQPTIDVGVNSIAWMERLQMRETNNYILATSMVAEVMNRRGQFDDALKIAMKGRVIAASKIPAGSPAAYNAFKVTAAVARAKWGLEQRDEAIQEYSLLLLQIEGNPACSRELMLEFLEESAAAFEVTGDEPRAASIRKKVEKLKHEAQADALLKVEKSRYSN